MRATRWRRAFLILNLLLVASVLVAAGRLAARPAPRTLTPGPVGLVPAEPPGEGPHPLHSYLSCKDLQIDGDSRLREEGLPPLTDGFADRHRLESTWRDLANPLDACVHLSRRESGARFAAFFVGDRCDDRYVLIRVEEDRAWFRDVETDELIELVVRRHPAGKLPPERPRRLPFSPVPGRWVVPRDTTAWFGRKGESALEEFTLVGTPDGLLVREVRAGSPLAGRGIERGDVVRSVNGVAVPSRARLLRCFRGKGSELERYVIAIERKGRTITVTYRVRR